MGAFLVSEDKGQTMCYFILALAMRKCIVCLSLFLHQQSVELLLSPTDQVRNERVSQEDVITR